MTAVERSIAQQLRETLRPFWRRFSAHQSISVGKMGVLGYLADHGATTSSTLAAAERVSPQAIATAVRELESLGLVARTPDDEDRRRVWVELTDMGRDRLAQERATSNLWLERAIADRLTADEVEMLESVLPVLRKLVKALPDE